jgi:hypothetical protein
MFLAQQEQAASNGTVLRNASKNTAPLVFSRKTDRLRSPQLVFSIGIGSYYTEPR